MKIKASVKLELKDYHYFMGEYLRLVVLFKEKGKLRKREIGRCLVDSDHYDDKELFYEEVKEILNNKEHIKGVAIEMIEKYFDDNKKIEERLNTKKDIKDHINNFKMEIEVEIKQ